MSNSQGHLMGLIVVLIWLRLDYEEEHLAYTWQHLARGAIVKCFLFDNDNQYHPRLSHPIPSQIYAHHH